MDFNRKEMTLVAAGTTVPMLNIDNSVWFRGNDCAALLDYKDPRGLSKDTWTLNGSRHWRHYFRRGVRAVLTLKSTS